VVLLEKIQPLAMDSKNSQCLIFADLFSKSHLPSSPHSPIKSLFHIILGMIDPQAVIYQGQFACIIE
jgi:hypothetical protein